MEVHINGEPREVPEGHSVRDLLESLDLAARPVAVEVNLQLVSRPEQAGWILQPGDRLEVVTLVGGG